MIRRKVLCDGKCNEEDASVLVPGDIVSIKLGDIIRIDARLLHGDPLKIDQVCGLKWSYDNRENYCCEHTAAMKATAWPPHLHGLLASGGGTADRCIRFWYTTTNSHLSCMDTGSQHFVEV